jgi:hypothetical protein
VILVMPGDCKRVSPAWMDRLNSVEVDPRVLIADLIIRLTVFDNCNIEQVWWPMSGPWKEVRFR